VDATWWYALSSSDVDHEVLWGFLTERHVVWIRNQCVAMQLACFGKVSVSFGWLPFWLTGTSIPTIIPILSTVRLSSGIGLSRAV
jgi:hypothetical protein